MKQVFRRFVPLLCAIAAASLVTLQVQAQEIKERNLKFSYGQPKEHPMGVGIQKFADLVAQKSGGKIKITPYPNAVLGGDNQNISGARGGTIDMTTLVTGGLVGVVKDFMLFDFPFLFNNEQEAFALADGPIGKKLMDKLPDVGLVGLGIWDLGFRNLTNGRHPVAKVEDIAGLKLRVVQVPIYLDVFKALGANAVPLAFPELYTALEQRAVDGQENPLGLIETNKFYEVQKYLTLTRHTYSGMAVVMSKKTWDTMSEAERKIIQDSAHEAGIEERKLSIANNARAVDTLKKTMQVSELSPAEVTRMRQKVQPVVDKYTKEIGEGFVKDAYSELNKIRGSK
jgi:tripartite ATP-independent transporter DctP family solute receptor